MSSSGCKSSSQERQQHRWMEGMSCPVSRLPAVSQCGPLPEWLSQGLELSVRSRALPAWGPDYSSNNVLSMSVLWRLSQQLTFKTLWSCSMTIHSGSVSSNCLNPSSCCCVTRSIAFRCFKAYSRKSKVEFQCITTSIGMQLMTRRRLLRISFQAGRILVVECMILKASLLKWTASGKGLTLVHHRSLCSVTDGAGLSLFPSGTKCCYFKG